MRLTHEVYGGIRGGGRKIYGFVVGLSRRGGGGRQRQRQPRQAVAMAMATAMAGGRAETRCGNKGQKISEYGRVDAGKR